MDYSVLMLALGANVCFALGSQIFTSFSRSIGAYWMNWFKASVALVLFSITILFFPSYWQSLESKIILILLLSGFVGLGIGDVFLLKGFGSMGPSRTIMIFGFQPLILGVLSYFLFGQVVELNRLFAIVFFIGCLLILSFESYKEKGHWEIQGLLYAFLGVCLDASGVLITRYAYESDLELNPLMSNFWRTIGAISFFILLKPFIKVYFINPLLKMRKRDRALAILGSILGTYLSLLFFLSALQKANLATLSGIAITGTVFSGIFECIIEKKAPSKYLWFALGSFFIGMRLLLF